MKIKILAFSSVLFLIIFNSLLVPPTGYSFITPSLPVAGIMFWALDKKNLFNNYHFFLLGLLNDLIMGTPLGSSSIFYFIIKLIIDLLKVRLKRNSIFVYIIKSIIGFSGYFISVYIFIIIYYEKYPSISYFFMSFLLTVVIFPIIYTIFKLIDLKSKLDEI